MLGNTLEIVTNTKLILFSLSLPFHFSFILPSRLSSDMPVHYQVEGSRQAIRVTLYLDSCHFSELPTRLQNGGSLKLHSALFTRGVYIIECGLK